MSTYLYKPECPIADGNGFISKEDYYLYKSMTVECKNMTVGNRRVEFQFISDTMEPTRHMALPINSAPITSKSLFRKITKEKGCIEIGNETKHLIKPRRQVKLDQRKRREDIKKAINDLKYGNIPRPV